MHQPVDWYEDFEDFIDKKKQNKQLDEKMKKFCLEFQLLNNAKMDDGRIAKVDGGYGVDLRKLKLKVFVLPTTLRSEIKILNLKDNELQTLPDAIGELENLEVLELDWVKVSLPEGIRNLKSLTELNLASRYLRKLDKGFGHFIHLKSLTLYNNLLQSLPASIGGLESLEKVNMGKNKLSALPESIGNLKNLEQLNLSENPLKSLPESFGGLEKLQALVISTCPIRSLPDSFAMLSELETLYISKNTLQDFDSQSRVIIKDLGCEVIETIY